MKPIFQLKHIIIIITILNLPDLFSSLKLRQDKKRRETKGENIGTGLYSSQIVTQAMKRPQKWFFNVMLHKPNERYFEEAEYNGLRYQTDMLQDKMEREYNDSVKAFYDEKLNVQEQKLITGVRLRKEENK